MLGRDQDGQLWQCEFCERWSSQRFPGCEIKVLITRLTLEDIVAGFLLSFWLRLEHVERQPRSSGRLCESVVPQVVVKAIEQMGLQTRSLAAVWRVTGLMSVLSKNSPKRIGARWERCRGSTTSVACSRRPSSRQRMPIGGAEYLVTSDCPSDHLPPRKLTSTSAFQAVAHSADSSATAAARSNRLASSQNEVNEEGGIICSTCDWQRERTRFSSKERQSCYRCRCAATSALALRDGRGSRVVGHTTRAETPITATPPRLLFPCTMSSKQYRKLCRGCWANKSNSSTTMTSGLDLRVAGVGASVAEVEVEASALTVDAEEGSSRRRRVDIVAELLDCVAKRELVRISREGKESKDWKRNARSLPRPLLRPWHRSRTLARRAGPQSLASPSDPSCAPSPTGEPRQSCARRARAKVA